MEITHQIPYHPKTIKLLLRKTAKINQIQIRIPLRIMEHIISQLLQIIQIKRMIPLYIRTLVSLINKINNGLKHLLNRAKEDIRLIYLQIKSFIDLMM